MVNHRPKPRRLAFEHLENRQLLDGSDGPVFRYTRIVDGNTKIPGSEERFAWVGGAALQDDGKLTFAGNGPPGPNRQSGIYIASEGGIAPLVVNGQEIPGRLGAKFTDIFGVTIDGDRIAISSQFIEADGRLNAGIFLLTNTSTKLLADRNTFVPDGEFLETFQQFGAVFLSGNKVLFGASGPTAGIYLASDDGPIHVIANTRMQAPNGTGVFFNFNQSENVRIDGDTIVFPLGTSHDGLISEGIYGYSNGDLNTIVDQSISVPGRPEDTFAGFYGLSDFDHGAFAFIGNHSDRRNQGVYIHNGSQIEVIADTTMTTDAGNQLLAFGDTVSLDGAAAVFAANDGDPVFGALFTNLTGQIKEVAREGGQIDGTPVTHFDFGYKSLKEQSIVFDVYSGPRAQGGLPYTYSIYRADLVEERPQGPRVTETFSNNTGILSHIDVLFDEPIIPSTFAIIHLTSPTGPLEVSDISIIPMNNTTIRVSFPPRDTPGLYSLRLSEKITDLVGNEVDQDGDRRFGDVPNDQAIINISLLPDETDTDGDGLFDSWELNGIDLDKDGVIDVALNKMGADPYVRDVFVEIDWLGAETEVGITHDHKPSGNALGKVVEAFAKYNINLWIDAGTDLVVPPSTITGKGGSIRADAAQGGDIIPHVRYLRFREQDDYRISGELGPDQMFVSDLKAMHFDNRRDVVFHYAIFGHALMTSNGTGSTGQGEGPGDGPSHSDILTGNDFLITLGSPRDPRYRDEDEADTFMHELGHNLGLQHGPHGSFLQCKPPGKSNCHPNYKSVMNYLWQNRKVTFLELGDGFVDYAPEDWHWLTAQDSPAYKFQFSPLFAAGVGLEPPEDLFEPLPAITWQNSEDHRDVSGDGLVVPLDVLLIINELNAEGPQKLPPPIAAEASPPFYDVSGDDFITALDALLIINFLNEGGAEGEAILVVANRRTISTVHDDVVSVRELVSDQKSGALARQLPSEPRQTAMKLRFQRPGRCLQSSLASMTCDSFVSLDDCVNEILVDIDHLLH